MSQSDEFAFLDAIAQAELVRRKEVKAIELVDAAIERIERLNPTLNAVITPMYEQARTAATSKLPGGPFDGVPFLLKDFAAFYAGVRMISGTAFTRDFVPDHDSELVKRFKRAGLITLGKTNTPELALLVTTEPRLFGPTYNPWDTERTPGGSSGGSSAAVASGIVPIAHGNDRGGSIRIPASCCGLVGLKPTRGRNFFGPDYGDMPAGLVSEHVVTRTVRDCAALLDATAGPAIGDPYVTPLPERPFLQEVSTNPRRLRIAFTDATLTGNKVHDDCARAVREAAALCADLGHEVVEAAPKIDSELLFQSFITVWSVSCAWTVDDMAITTGRTPTPDQFEPLTWAIYEKGRQCSASAYLLAETALQKVTRGIAPFFVGHDVWLTPTLGQPPVPLGTFDAPPEDPLQVLSRVATFSPFTRIFNVTGQPAITLPLFWNADGLPIGTHLVARFGDEATLFRLAAQLEEARSWADRRPPVSA